MTSQNVARMQQIHASLEENLLELLKQVKKYPVELYFEGNRYLFDNENDVRALLAELKAGIDAVRAA